MDELTQEQEEVVAATVGAIQRIAMAIVELPKEQRTAHYGNEESRQSSTGQNCAPGKSPFKVNDWVLSQRGRLPCVPRVMGPCA
jgi:hypothetical protein